ncbi:gas vesicle protein GvpG [Priestia megaterium]|uniref:Gas vesicle G family protein n=1 Tax=Priestia megaterium (strain ATCC 14581 / DSM 32 / CCUG 1817 / JCM 2506 / NBRC 15308 / NCIMB 9376 / NCTC 10342 / NRRL B-14308 / VKM B-512 / Ford 19) TaxID=1348623 RepID=A0A0B6AK18_PRIM2|nr:gas vesicle protein GvpG [Priestia megaterium]AJI25240.1 gas vesicle G family protein [Priestia megaterium NBRC 15308 = ATCC 14581]KFN05263.1 gas vesicle G family protein [Priestia megaterium]KGJ77399.1 gas vesicle protein GvpG [Priestia megaterium NBRC 15308 = ATCC 14581]MDH3186152.1 gas vesicle protein GvpG [Priestia megaterium]MDQ0805873.1 S-adenosylmethionine:tRNA-ribosyltransferase-isomerase (queuine synthetase) [Priestia megaterium]
MIHKLLLSPVTLIVKVGKKIKEEADKELYDVSFIQQKIVHLQMMYELGEIPEDAYMEKEKELLLRYEAAKEYELKRWESMTKKQK